MSVCVHAVCVCQEEEEEERGWEEKGEGDNQKNASKKEGILHADMDEDESEWLDWLTWG